MTAIEWQFEQLFNSFEKFNNGEYSFNEYLKRNLEIREQAKEIEKQQVVEAFDIGYANAIHRVVQERENTIQYGEQYYNETFNK